MDDIISHCGPLWVWSNGQSPASWHFLTIDGVAGEAIAAHAAMRRLEDGRGRGFGSVRVAARIGASCWNTSVFPSAEAGGFVLPVKAAIRRAEGLAAGEETAVELDLL